MQAKTASRQISGAGEALLFFFFVSCFPSYLLHARPDRFARPAVERACLPDDRFICGLETVVVVIFVCLYGAVAKGALSCCNQPRGATHSLNDAPDIRSSGNLATASSGVFPRPISSLR